MFLLTNIKPYLSLSRNQLKWIAMLTMLIDHIGFLFLGHLGEESLLYLLFRIIGRISFPLFCFLLVQGFLSTRNEARYAGRLFVFALISEIPYDFFKYGKLFYLKDQNILFTFSVSVLVLMLLKRIEFSDIPYYKLLRRLLVVICGVIVTYLLRADYALLGILYTAVIYGCRRRLYEQFFLLGILMLMSNWLNPWQILALPFLFFCRDKIMEKEQAGDERPAAYWKYMFYIFYPVHMILLKIIFIIL